ncbi:MAG: Smr/MutS family protein, partial [Cytophagales bacterium]|nr:Smr/MutS family protein [Cytophagales bacterium]
EVKIDSQDAIAKVISIKGNQVEVMVGELRIHVKKSRLQKLHIAPSYSKKKVKKSSSTVGSSMIKSTANFSSELDVRGMRTIEALGAVDAFIDKAIISGTQAVNILHGKGNGILRPMIRQHLKGLSYIQSMEDAHEDRGGAGITVINLK